MKPIAFLIVFLPGIAFAGDWDGTEKVLFGSFLTLETMDYLQTKEILKSDRFHEQNPILKNNEKYVTPYFMGCVLVGYLIADNLSPAKRKAFLGALNILEIGMVGSNYKLGVKFKF